MAATAPPSPALTAEAAIGFEDAGVSYDGRCWALRGLDLTVPQGEFLCLLGANGSGKSTVAKAIDALVLPQEGRVSVFGRDTRDADEAFFIRSNAALVFQNPDDQLVASLVENDVAFGPENLGVPNPELRQRVTDALAQVGLSGFERYEVSSLSGGQKQRVAIAGALAMDPAIIVLDEATAMLDPRGRASLLRVARQLHEDGLTVVMVTHFMEEAAQAERVVVLDGGRIALDGAPDEVFADSRRLESLGLEPPFPCRLAAQLADAGIEVAPSLEPEALASELSALRKRLAAEGRLEPFPADELAALRALPAQRPVPRTPAVLRFEDVSFSYDEKAAEPRRRRRAGREERPAWGSAPGEGWALRDVSFEVRAGGFLGIAGHTGSGKSTLMTLMNGLLRADEGKVCAFGCDLADKRAAAEARHRVGVVFQYPESQLFAPTVYEDVAFGPRNLGLGPEEVADRVRRALAAVHLDAEEVAAMSPFALSGGQQRRAALAGVLAMEPELLVLDEPAAGLDPQGRRSILGLVEELHAGGLTVVMASHSMEDLGRLADYMLVLEAGRLVRRGTPAEVFSDPDGLRGLGLGVPAPEAMAAALRDEGFVLPRRLYDGESLAHDIASNLQGGRS